MSINRVTITGNLTRDPEIRMNANGVAVLNFGVAVNDRYHNKQTDQWEDRPNFVDCVLFGQRAQSLSNILRKGFKCAIEGKLRYNSWEDKNTGQKRSKLEVAVDDIDFMQPKGHGQGSYQQAGYQQQQPAPMPAYQTPAPMPTYQAPAPMPAAQQQPVQQPAQPVQAQPVQQQMPVQQTVSQGQPASPYDPDIPF